MELETILKIVSIVASFLVVTVIPSIIALVKYVKKYKAAQTEAEKQAAINDLSDMAKNFIADAEKLYASINAAMKITGQSISTGKLKKETVMSKLAQYALNKGYSFDEEYWSIKVDEFVNITKAVNAQNS